MRVNLTSFEQCGAAQRMKSRVTKYMVPICSSSTGLKRPNPGLERETTMNARASKENRASRLLGALFEWIGQLPATGVCHSRDHEEVAWCCDSDLIKTRHKIDGKKQFFVEKRMTPRPTTYVHHRLSAIQAHSENIERGI